MILLATCMHTSSLSVIYKKSQALDERKVFGYLSIESITNFMECHNTFHSLARHSNETKDLILNDICIAKEKRALIAVACFLS